MVCRLLDDNWFLASHFQIEDVQIPNDGVRSSKVINILRHIFSINQSRKIEILHVFQSISEDRHPPRQFSEDQIAEKEKGNLLYSFDYSDLYSGGTNVHCRSPPFITSQIDFPDHLSKP